jgi:acyl-CoA synthetase (AMP-forming)/AMP-acid ligase II
MIGLLDRAAASTPDTLAVSTPEGASTYAELLQEARTVGAALRDRRIDRFAVVEPDARVVLALLAGAALAGAEPCQYQADVAVGEFTAQAGVLGHRVVVTRRDDLAGPFDVVRPDDLLAGSPDHTLSAGPTQPLLIRTTGSTGLPTAAKHDWQVLARTVASVRPRPTQRWLLAYGPHQFAGVQVMQHVLASQATLVAPFPREPRESLTALVEHGVTCVSATPTYWRFLLAEARARDLQLPPLEQITLGGEATSADLLGELRRTFPGARISQVYASTEFGSVASVSDGMPGLAVDSMFSEANPAANLRVIDGELWVRSDHGMLGYAQASDAETTDHDGWRPTGDLVEVVGDRVMFRGRTSEVINVGGVKVHPLPVEQRITAVAGVAMARVFGRANRLTGAIVAAEVVPTAGADQDRVREDIRAAVADLPRAWHPRSVSFVATIETLGEKTLRRLDSGHDD